MSFFAMAMMILDEEEISSFASTKLTKNLPTDDEASAQKPEN